MDFSIILANAKITVIVYCNCKNQTYKITKQTINKTQISRWDKCKEAGEQWKDNKVKENANVGKWNLYKIKLN